MPSLRASLRAFHAFAAALIRAVATAIVGSFALFALVLLALRYVVFPQVESYRDTVAATLAKQLGHPVEIAALTTGWDGWNPKLTIQGFRVLDRARSDASPLLELPEVGLVVAWTSLPLFELRLKELIIDRPRLAVRRDRGGVLHVAGIEIDPAQAADDTTFTDWLLRQREIVVRDALITWDDDQRNAPQLVLDRVQFRLENGFSRHRFGLRGTPPAELAAPLDLRGDLTGGSVRDWQHAEGALFVRLDYADVGAWREWLPLPEQLARGKGALRVWFQFAHGEAREVIADLELADVKARLGEGLPELALAHLSGRAGWRSDASERHVFTRDLAFVTTEGQQLDPTDFSLTLRDAVRERPASGQMEFDRLQLEPLVALSEHLPIAESIRTNLARFAPRGTLVHGRAQWEGAPEAPTRYAAAAQFIQFGLSAQDAFPGATGLSGRFEATQDHGEIRIVGSAASVDLPRVLSGPIDLDSLQSVVKWELHDGRSTVRIEQLDFANADAAGSASGTYRTSGNGKGEIDLAARATRVDGAHVYRYLPRAAKEPARNWLRAAITQGTMTDVRVKLAGNLADFPFANGKGGQLTATARAKGATLTYHERWPAIEAIDADIRVDGTRLMIDAARARCYGVDIGKTHAEIADFATEGPVLRIEGEAAGPAEGFVRFANDSPVANRIDRITDGVDAAGTAHLALKLALHLGRWERSTFDGELAMTDAQIKHPSLPLLTRVSGKVAFSERDVHAQDVTLDVLGGPSRIAVATDEGHVRISGSGNVNLAALRRDFPPALVDRVSGSVDWNVAIALRAGVVSWTLDSTLTGAALDLPAPLGKTTVEAMPLRIERREEAARADGDYVTATYGRAAMLTVHRRPGESGPTIDRALLSLGRAMERPEALRAERPGLWMRAELPNFNVDDWLVLMPRGSAAEAARDEEGMSFAGADLDVNALDAFGVTFGAVKVKMREAQRGWRFDLDGRDVAGSATWSAPGAGAPNGRLVARLARLAITDRAASQGAGGERRETKADATTRNRWPEIDLAADVLRSREHELGRLEFVASPRGTDWLIERLVVANDDGRLNAEGAWQAGARVQQTKLDVVLDVKESGAFLARFGYPDALQGAPTKIQGQLAWTGAPHEFDFPTLTGAFRIDVGSGRFTKIEPGPGGRLLNVLSLQALPRRVTLDFRDVFSDGFMFDEIAGNVKIASGVMSSNDLKLVGSAAKVDISGDTDLAKETQRLSVRVQPSLSTSVSAGAALLFLANPLVGAAVGAGSLLAQTVLKDPVGQMFTFQYTVTGSWSDPVVTRTTNATASVAPGSGPASTGETR